MSKVKRLVAGGLLVASDVVAAHQGGFPHHFLSEPNTEHYWLIGSGFEYVFACVVATVVFFALRRVAVKKK